VYIRKEEFPALKNTNYAGSTIHQKKRSNLESLGKSTSNMTMKRKDMKVR
jgi:hypothetical protein